MEDKLVKIWMPISKSDGKFQAILTDTSLDSDDEMMGETVMDQLDKKMALPTLIDHKNTMESWIGGFQNIKKVHKNGHVAITSEPSFFSKEANPKAAQVQKQMEEAGAMGLSAGISIGAKTIASKMIKKDGKDVKVWTELDVREASFTPVQSNTNSYTYVAKTFGLEGQEKVQKSDSKLINKKPEVDKTMSKENLKKKPDEGEPEAPSEDAPKESEAPVESEAPKEDIKEPTEDAEKKVEAEIQKRVDEAVEKAVKKMPLYKAITENIAERDDEPKSQGLNFLERSLAQGAGLEVEK